MALQHGKLADIQTLPSTAGSIYANPASTKTYIRCIAIHNANTTSETVELWNVPDSSGALGSSGDTNKIFKAAVTAGDTVFIDLEFPIVLTDTNDAIFGKTTTVSKVTVQILGDKDA